MSAVSFVSNPVLPTTSCLVHPSSTLTNSPPLHCSAAELPQGPERDRPTDLPIAGHKSSIAVTAILGKPTNCPHQASQQTSERVARKGRSTMLSHYQASHARAAACANIHWRSLALKMATDMTVKQEPEDISTPSVSSSSPNHRRMAPPPPSATRGGFSRSGARTFFPILSLIPSFTQV